MMKLPPWRKPVPYSRQNHSNDYSTSLHLDFKLPSSISCKAKAILSNILVQGVDGGSELVTKSITLAKAQNLVILVKGIKYGDSGGHGVYNVEITGPVELAK